MTGLAPRLAAFALAVLLTGIAPSQTPGFADLTQLVASHPLHGVLLEYDREIAALSSTQNATGDNAAATQRNAAVVRRDAAAVEKGN